MSHRRREVSDAAQTCERYTAACPVGFIPPKVPYGSSSNRVTAGRAMRALDKRSPTNMIARYRTAAPCGGICKPFATNASPAWDPKKSVRILTEVRVPAPATLLQRPAPDFSMNCHVNLFTWFPASGVVFLVLSSNCLAAKPASPASEIVPGALQPPAVVIGFVGGFVRHNDTVH